MSGLSKYTYKEVGEAGKLGDTPVYLALTARQVSALQFVVAVAIDNGVGLLALASVADGLGEEFAALLNLEFDRAQARIGIAMGRALDEPDVELRGAARLAELDQRAQEIGA